MIKAIIFDWHGVIDRTSYKGLINIISKSTRRSENVIASMLSPFKQDLVTGKVDEVFVLNALANLMNRDTSIMSGALSYSTNIELDKNLLHEIENLSKKYTLALMSDSTSRKARIIKNIHELKYFTELVFSSDLGYSKESEYIFSYLSNKIKVLPEHTLYVDDSTENVNFAKKLGYIGHQYVNPEKLISELLHRG